MFDEKRSVNPQNSQHIIIEGENLEVLKLLKESYREKIKCIYIDPPYNTGKDFVYSDNFTQDKRAYWQNNGTVDAGIKMDTNSESDGRYHSHWLNMMFSRLLLARELLSDDGVIFISIDDNEVHHLRKLCDEVFGEGNLVAGITVLCNPKGRSQDKYFATNHEHLLIYSKSTLLKGFFSIEKDEQQIESEYSEEDDAGRYRLLELRNTHREFGKHNRKNLYYPIYVKDDAEVSLTPIYELHKVLPVWDDGFEGCWTWDKHKAGRDLDLLTAKKVNSRWKIYRKSYANGSDRMLKTILTDKLFYTERGQKEFNSLFNTKAKLFQSPKSLHLLAQLFLTITSENDLILDFFGGSGTTGHAVMELNKADGGNRQFILVQIPEQTDEASEANKAGYKKISDITIARNKKVVEKLQTEGVETGFKVFKLAMSNFPRALFEADPKLDEAENLQRLQTYISEKERQLFNTFDESNLLTEILIKRGFNLNYQITKAEKLTKNNVLWITDGHKKAFVCIDNQLADETITYFTENISEYFICLKRALDTTKKWNLKHAMGHMFFAF